MESQSVFQAEIQVKMSSIELPPWIADQLQQARALSAEVLGPRVEGVASVQRVESGPLHQRRENVHKLDQLVRHDGGIDDARDVQHQRSSVCDLKVGVLLPLGVLAHVKTVVAEEDDDRVFCQSETVEYI